MKAFAIAILPLVLGVHAAQAADYPSEMRGAWGALRDCLECPDRLEIAQRNCNVYRAVREKDGTVLMFDKTKRWSFGGESDYVGRNVSVKKIRTGRWKIADRQFDDHAEPVWQTRVYEAAIKGDRLVIKDKDGYVNRYARCQPPLNLPRDIKPLSEEKASRR